MNLTLTSLVGTPIGRILIACLETTIVGVDFTEERLSRLLERRFGKVEFVSACLYRSEFEAYFAGELTALERLSHEPGGTAFQRLVWQSLRTIPIGQTWTYTEVARSIGRERSARAVGLANALNPISLVIPCHRVLGLSGSLTGYAGGLATKEWLLGHEAGGSH